MSVRLVQRAEVIAMNLAIRAMDITSRSSILSRIFLQGYKLAKSGSLILWSGVILISGIVGFLCGYLGYYFFLR